MSASLAIPLAVERVRRNPVRVPIRNLVASRSDQMVFAIQVFESDGSPSDITGESIYINLTREHHARRTWDYGADWCSREALPQFQAQALIFDPTSGQGTVAVPAGVCWRGRYRMDVLLGDMTGSVVLCRGDLDILRGAPVPVLNPAVLAIVSDGTLSIATQLLYGTDGSPLIDPATGQALMGAAEYASGALGARLATFTITLAQPATQLVTASWKAVYGDASPMYVQACSPDDFVAASGEVVFQPGQQTVAVTVTVRPDDPTKTQSRFNVVANPGVGCFFFRPVGVQIIPGAAPVNAGDFSSNDFGGDLLGGSGT